MNRQIRLASRPEGLPAESNFELHEAPLPAIAQGEFLIEIAYLSVDPYMRGRMNDSKSYADPVQIGAVMVGEAVGRVRESNHSKFPRGTWVCGMFGWQEFAKSNGEGVRRLKHEDAPVSTALHVLGMPGITSYFGIHDVCQVQRNQTLLVSAAAGAVGSTAGQLAKGLGCRVVGIAGSDEKVAWLKELGFDDAFNYKSTDDYYSSIKKACPDGVDAYFDNVGGPITDAVFPLLNIGARIAICGQISQYNVSEPQEGPRLLWHLIVKRATIRGFLVTDYGPRFREALTALADNFRDGKLKYRERISEGIENAPTAFIEMMQGANIGKQLVKLADA